MIGKVERTVTETGTSLDQNIELTQRGTIQIVPTTAVGNKLMAIPCSIPFPQALNIYPMTSDAAIALSGSTAEAHNYQDFVLHWATGASNSFGSVASNVFASDVGYRLRMDTASYSLFVATASAYATGAASNTRLASKSFWRKVDGFANNQRKYLLVNIANGVSDTFKTRKLKFKYEIKGY